VNGDGYDDLVAGADAYEEALVFLGPDLTLTSRLQSDCPSPFGYSVANAGDVNGDGYEDVIVGSPEILGWPDGSGPGCVAVYFGSADGVTGEPDVTLLGDEADLDRQFGGVVAGLGDLNADGYDDFGVSSEYDGRVYAFAGSASPAPSGTSADAWALEYLGYTTSLDAAGDVNADGFADVFGAGRDGGQVLLGSAVGLGAGTSVWGPEGAARSGAGAGDVNGDGYDDVIAADQDSYIFLGGATGISARPSATLRCHSADGWLEAGAGDVDGDGLDDVLVSSGDEVCLFLGATLAGPGETGVDAGPGETGVVDSPDSAPHYPGTAPDTSDSDDAAAWMNEDDTEGQPTHPGKSGCAGGGCGGGSVSAVVVLLSLSGVRRRRE